jgi:hypothetical protein
MQTRPSDTPKIILLVVAIVVVLIFVFWQVTTATQTPANTAAPGVAPQTAATSPRPSGAAGVQLASASDSAAVGPGQVREMRYDPRLDAEPSPEDVQRGLTIPSSPGNAFKVIAEPKPVEAPHAKTPPVHSTPPPPSNNEGQTGAALPQFHFITRSFKVEGVVTGSDGFAMITEGDMTYFKHVGETLAGYRIMRLHENGVTVRPVGGGEAEIWPIGEMTAVNIRVPGPPPASLGGLRAEPLPTAPSGTLRGFAPGAAGQAPAAGGAPTNPNPQQVPTLSPQ